MSTALIRNTGRPDSRAGNFVGGRPRGICTGNSYNVDCG